MEQKIMAGEDGRRLNVIGDSQLIKLTGADTGGVFTMIQQGNPPGVGIPLHVHRNEDEMFHIVEGTMEFTLGDKTVTAGAGSTVWLPRNIPHAFMVTGNALAKTIVMAFPSGIEHMFEELSALPPGPPDMPTILAICERYGISFLSPPDPAEDDLAAV